MQLRGGAEGHAAGGLGHATINDAALWVPLGCCDLASTAGPGLRALTAVLLIEEHCDCGLSVELLGGETGSLAGRFLGQRI